MGVLWSFITLVIKTGICDHKTFMFPVRLGILSVLEFEYDSVSVSVVQRSYVFNLPNENTQLLGLIRGFPISLSRFVLP